jgi:hypothetical protein
MGYTDMLYAIPSFIGGVAATLDMGGTLSMYNDSKSPELADAKALASDWCAVGGDMREAIRAFEKEHDEAK